MSFCLSWELVGAGLGASLAEEEKDGAKDYFLLERVSWTV